jgi:hypothetical protein
MNQRTSLFKKTSPYPDGYKISLIFQIINQYIFGPAKAFCHFDIEFPFQIILYSPLCMVRKKPNLAILQLLCPSNVEWSFKKSILTLVSVIQELSGG